ncbi:NmrA family NAD(P)-binding protein [Runella sp.]|uniref:NmrA family NAD(P)-binding protein n=1 Tax=Runella sp. TaxID=1960881 RepID=UPI003D0AD607
MKKIIAVAGGTGNLGERIVKALLDQGAEVRALVRSNTNLKKVNRLEKLGAKVIKADMQNTAEVAAACKGATCVVSALAGLRDVIIDTQKILLDAAIAAEVPRFIPSDYSLDFTKFPDGENRNLDLRREFHTYLDTKPIAATTIFNGAFTDLLTDQMPLIVFKHKLVLYWGDADHRLWFTTMDDTATFTAHAALDPSTPRFLVIAGDQRSPREIRADVSDVTGEKFRLLRAGGPGLLSLFIKLARTFSPAKNDLYPAWQGMQYMRNMIDKRANLTTTDNNRYSGMQWTSVKKMLSEPQANSK